MQKLSKTITVFLAVLLILNMVHTPCICGAVFSAESGHSCGAKKVVTEAPKHSCCAKKAAQETEEQKTHSKPCSSDKCCSNWFYYIKTADFASSDRVDKAISSLDAITAIIPSVVYISDIAQSKAYQLLHPPDIVPKAPRNPILRI
jgi:hypothetical protein